jgi:histone acetyltransferase (RNA polymerase elongator complex component)
MHKTFREFNGKTFMLDEFSYFGISKSDAEKRKEIWKKSGLGARLVKKANGKYVVYREYHGDKNEVDSSSLFPEG